MGWAKRLWHRFELQIAKRVGARFVRWLVKSYRLTVVGVEPNTPVIYAVWHQRMFPFVGVFRDRDYLSMASTSRDGERIATVATQLGFRLVRGSSRRRGEEARQEMVCELKARPATSGMFVDGPTGPARACKIGTILIARDAGLPIVPLTYSTSRAWIFRSWDRYLIPKPFARVVLVFGDRMAVPNDASPDDLEARRRELEEALNRLTAIADRSLNVHYPEQRAVAHEAVLLPHVDG